VPALQQVILLDCTNIAQNWGDYWIAH